MEYVEKKYIVLVEYGDPVTSEKLSTSWGSLKLKKMQGSLLNHTTRARITYVQSYL